MRESRVAGAPRAWRALLLVLLGVLLGSAGSGMVRASGPEVECAAAPLQRVREVSPSLPPEWRWTPPSVSVDHMYGTRRSR